MAVLESSCFYVGPPDCPIYVDHLPPSSGQAQSVPIIMVHGGGHTGACYLATPDGRPGWGPYFTAAGHRVFVPDWPGHGRSPIGPNFATLSSWDVMRALSGLLDVVGPALLLVHSASGPMAWHLAEQQPDKVIAIVGVAPGPPANLQPVLPDDPGAVNALRFDEEAGCPIYSPEDRPVWMPADFIAAYWAGSPRFPRAALDAYAKSIVPESARLLNERFNIGGRGLRVEVPEVVAERPILIVTGEHDPRHPRQLDEKTARFFGADFIWLPDEGIRDNGHMLMIEDNHTQIADLILAWMDRRQLRGSASSAQATEKQPHLQQWRRRS